MSSSKTLWTPSLNSTKQAISLVWNLAVELLPPTAQNKAKNLDFQNILEEGQVLRFASFQKATEDSLINCFLVPPTAYPIHPTRPLQCILGHLIDDEVGILFITMFLTISDLSQWKGHESWWHNRLHEGCQNSKLHIHKDPVFV